MIMFTRHDWQLFQSLDTLGQKAGVHRDKLAALVVKEAVDNALDAHEECSFGLLTDKNGFFVEDDGAGIPGSDEEVAALFSVNRPLTSSKLLRLPRRGQLGNGNRVIAGAVAASDGTLTVTTNGRKLALAPRLDDGGTDFKRLEDVNGSTGTLLEITFGPDLPICDFQHFLWAKRAGMLAKLGRQYRGRTSAWWYSSSTFHDLLQAAGDTTIRTLIEQFDKCSGKNAGKVAADFLGRRCSSLSRAESDALLAAARDHSESVVPARLGEIGKHVPGYPNGYAIIRGTFSPRGSKNEMRAELPFVLEAWANVSPAPDVEMTVNRTPISSNVWLTRMKDKASYGLVGCGLDNPEENTATGFQVGAKRDFDFLVNLCTPYIPLSTDGKEPDLSYFRDEMAEVLRRAAKRAKMRGAGRATSIDRQKNHVIRDLLPAAIEQASNGGVNIYSQRKLYYCLRPLFTAEVGEEPKWGYFCQVITAHEAESGSDLPGMYRDDRGVLYHPHSGEKIPLGTRSVAAYERPKWRFNKCVYLEKEGLFESLIHAKWPEMNDCALLTSKGYASRAARDLIDILGETPEDLTFFAVHDADGPGTVIFQALTEATLARGSRTVHVENIGLEPEEGIELDLPVEPVERKEGNRVPVANYVQEPWRTWLQKHRIELDAIPNFVEWLSSKIAGKLIPPHRVLKDCLREQTKALVRQRTVNRILQEANIDAQVEKQIRRLNPALKESARTLPERVKASLAIGPAQPWTEPVAAAANSLVAGS